jgi:deoxyribonuclease-4
MDSLKMKIGYHAPLIEPIVRTFQDLEGSPTAVQIFLGPPLSYAKFKHTLTDLVTCRRFLAENEISPIVHAAYLYNLANADKRDLIKSSVIKELDDATTISAPVVIHTGSEKNKSKIVPEVCRTIREIFETATDKTIEYATALDIPLDEFVDSRKLLLENAAGEGNKIGSDLSELQNIIEELGDERIGICIDTCHLFSAGRLRKDRISEDLGAIFMNPEVVHLNDSKTRFGGCCDRHASIYSGELFEKDESRLKEVLDYCQLVGAKVVTETDMNELGKIRKLI